MSALGSEDFRSRNPRFAGEAGAANLAIVDAVSKVAETKGVAPAQVALAWVYRAGRRLGIPVVPIPGTKRVKWLEQNVGALDVELTRGRSGAARPAGQQVVGSRY